MADLALAASRFCAAALNLDRRLKAGPVVSANGGRGSVNIQLVKSKHPSPWNHRRNSRPLSPLFPSLTKPFTRAGASEKSGQADCSIFTSFQFTVWKTGLQRVTEALKEKSERVGYECQMRAFSSVWCNQMCSCEYLGHHDHPCPPRRKISDGLNLFRGWIYALIVGTRRYGRVAGGAHASPRTPIVGFFFHGEIG